MMMPPDPIMPFKDVSHKRKPPIKCAAGFPSIINRGVEYDIPRVSFVTYFPKANVLMLLNSVSDENNTPNSKSVIVNSRLPDTSSLSFCLFSS